MVKWVQGEKRGLREMKKSVLLIFCISVFFLVFAVVSSANSAEPPSIVIIVNNPPENLSISLEDTMTKAIVYKKAWEAQYSFYSRDLRGDSSHTLIVSNDTDSDYYKIDVPVQSYRNIYTLDIKNKIITPGIHPLRSVILVSLRVFLTLLIEGCIFWLFGFRGKKSWVLFLVINLVTQGALNLWLDSFAITQSYLILALFVGEVLVFITEIALFSIAVKEYKVLRRIVYTLSANTASLVAGGFLITLLPV